MPTSIAATKACLKASGAPRAWRAHIDFGGLPEQVAGEDKMNALVEKTISFFKTARSHPQIDVAPSFEINVFSRIFIEPCFNICGLRCPYCPVGRRLKVRGMQRGMMSLDLFTRIWKKSMQRYRGQVALYNWGESFLNPDLPGMVRHVREISAAKLLLNSSFSLQCDNRILEMLKHLEDDTIVISCDGFSQETCEKYRVDVNFSQVMHNIELISGNKKPQTQLHWQYLRFPWNLDEIEAARDFCERRQIGFYPGEGGFSDNYPMLPMPRTAQQDRFRCEAVFNSLSINYDGEIYPCCSYYGPPQYSLGNAAKSGIEDIFTRGKGKEMLDYLEFRSSGVDGLFCKHCVERDQSVIEAWK
jgi:radical SAM protein with 4Fe4S-binding SPASM domain